MIKLKTLKFGDKVYIAKETNHVFTQKRLTMVDADGVEWFRYDRDRFTYTIEELTYCGKVTFTEEGEVRFDEGRETEYHFRHPDGQIHPEYEDSWDQKYWFYTREEAESCINQLKAERQ